MRVARPELYAFAGHAGSDASACTEWVGGRVDCQHWSPAGIEPGRRAVPEEVPVAFTINDRDYAVMLASPADVTDFAYGFLLGEGLIGDADEVDAIDVHIRPEGLIVQVSLHGDMPQARRERPLAGVSSCGLCGVETLRDAIKPTRRVSAGPVFDGAAVTRAMSTLRDFQPCNAVTGAMHAAAFADTKGNLLYAREDVGRHNALDKLVGALLRDGRRMDAGFIVLSSRCSYELVQKAAAFGARLLCTASAPTALAVRLAKEANLTLLSLVRGNSFIVLAGGERILSNEELAGG